MDYSKITNVSFEGIDHNDYPDYCDAYLTYAEIDGIPLTEDELIEVDQSDYKYDLLIDYLN